MGRKSRKMRGKIDSQVPHFIRLLQGAKGNKWSPEKGRVINISAWWNIGSDSSSHSSPWRTICSNSKQANSFLIALDVDTSLPKDDAIHPSLLPLFLIWLESSFQIKVVYPEMAKVFGILSFEIGPWSSEFSPFIFIKRVTLFPHIYLFFCFCKGERNWGWERKKKGRNFYKNF